MKKFKQVIFLVIMAMAVAFTSCTKEGPQGPPGENGTDGIDGTNGVDGIAGCVECHNNDADIKLKTSQFMFSKHYLGGVEKTGYGDRYGGSCSMCHTHQGFIHAVENGNNDGGAHAEANAMTCYTCHQIHVSYTRDDYAMNHEGAISLIMNDAAYFDGVTVDVGEPSNTCAKCHQARNRGTDTPDLNSTESKLITSGHYGPHYGTQGIIHGGKGGYFAPDAEDGAHNCVSCHINRGATTENGGEYYGGHAFNLNRKVYDEETGEMTEYYAYTDACTECHTSLDGNFDVNGIQAGVRAKLEALKAELMLQNIMDDHDHIITGGTYTQEQLAAFWNYKLVKDDGSYGIHNKTYANNLLDGALSALQN
ncbi:collagen-like triple helix repeat-containing protein [Carboxylicivirga sp. RSCT41]|uniref:collagen-like triple helix repeat-containing protein n=1 Tax=Carboxylicivirga agarovorans TaxID=3417570 RepID=UPI003D33756F